jgi:excisionase family DNA binding protein
MPIFISMYDAAERAGVSVKTIRNWISRGNLQAYEFKGSRLIRIDADEFENSFIPMNGHLIRGAKR